MTGTALTWQQLRDLKRPEFEDAGDGWHEVSGRADADRVRTDKAMTAKLRDTQDSESAKAAVARLERLSRNYQYIQTESGLIRTTLNGLAAELADPQRQLKQALDEAEGLKFTVHTDGSISYPAAVVCGDPWQARRARRTYRAAPRRAARGSPGTPPRTERAARIRPQSQPVRGHGPGHRGPHGAGGAIGR